MARLLGGLLLGTVAAFAAMFLVQRLGHLAWPLPAELDLKDPETAARAFDQVPVAAKLVLVLGWFAGGLIGASTAGIMSGRSWVGWAVAGLVAGFGVVTALLLPLPVWMQVSAIATPLLGGLVAHHLPFGRRAGERNGAA